MLKTPSLDFPTATHLFLYLNVELFDTLQGQFLPFDENPDRVSHEAFRHAKYLGRHGGRQQDHLNFRIQVAENVIDLIFESSRQHLVSFIQDENANIIRIWRKKTTNLGNNSDTTFQQNRPRVSDENITTPMSNVLKFHYEYFTVFIFC